MTGKRGQTGNRCLVTMSKSSVTTPKFSQRLPKLRDDSHFEKENGKIGLSRKSHVNSPQGKMFLPYFSLFCKVGTWVPCLTPFFPPGKAKPNIF
jgi:hypothetical protein